MSCTLWYCTASTVSVPTAERKEGREVNAGGEVRKSVLRVTTDEYGTA